MEHNSLTWKMDWEKNLLFSHGQFLDSFLKMLEYHNVGQETL